MFVCCDFHTAEKAITRNRDVMSTLNNEYLPSLVLFLFIISAQYTLQNIYLTYNVIMLKLKKEI